MLGRVNLFGGGVQRRLAFFIRENDGSESQTRFIGRVDGCGFGGNGNAFAVER
jgi:hypothetical protein